MTVTIGEQGDVSMSPHSLGNPRTPEESTSSENWMLPLCQCDHQIQFDTSDLKWKTVEEGSSSTKLVSKWWKEWPVASPVTHLSYSPSYYYGSPIPSLWCVPTPTPFFFSEGGGNHRNPENNFERAYRCRPFGP
jgi:hypothetical protein